MQQTGRWLRRGAWAAAALAVLAGAVWWGLPALLLSQLPPRLSEALGRPVTLQAVEFVPWKLSLTLRGLRIGAAGEPAAGAATSAAAPAGPPLLLQVERLHADLSLASLRHRAPVVEALAIDGLRLNLARTAAGHYDIDDLIERFKPRPKDTPAGEPARFSLNNLALRDAQIRFDDRPVGQVHRVQALTLTLPFLSNLPTDVAIQTQPRLAFKLNSTQFDTGSQALPFADTRSGKLTLKFADHDLQPWLGYLPAGLPVRLLQARLSSDLSLSFALPPTGAPSVSVQGRLGLKDVALAEPGGTPLASWQALSLDLVDVQPLARQVKLGALQVDGARLQLSRNAQGQLNWLRLGAPTRNPQAAAPAPAVATAAAAAPSAAPTAKADAAAPSPWAITLASIKLNGGQLRWTDDAVKPQAALQLDELSIALEGVHWPAPAPLPLSASAVLRGPRDGAPPVGRLTLTGQANDRQAAVTLALTELDLAALSPYLAQALQPRVSGQLAAQAQLTWAADPAALTVKLDSARLQDLQLREGAAPRAPRLASLRDGQLAAVHADLLARRLSIGSVKLVQPVIALSRDADGVINVQQWAAAPGTATSASSTAKPAAAAARPTRPPQPNAGTAAPWRIALQDLSISGGQVQWRDARTTDPHTGEALRADVSALKLRLQGLVWPAPSQAGAPLPRLQLTARIGAPAQPGVADALGDIDWAGRFGLNPLLADGQLQVRRFPVHLFKPYAGNEVPVSVLHADASFQGKLRLRATAPGWQVASDGDLQLAELRVNALPEAGKPPDSGDELLTWQSLTLQGLSLLMAPPARPQLVVREATLTDFYSRLIVTERGRLNLQDVAVQRPAGAATGAPAASAAATAGTGASAPATATAATTTTSAAADPAIDLDIGGIVLRNGRVDFSDRFVRPNYSARLTELNGQIGRLRSGTREMATITLRGRAADTALLDISGAFNPTANPLALDIRARATDLELAPLSPYAGKYAGYAIARGKLSMDVSYKIDADGKLDARNQVILNQLTFGERVDSPSATQLPVRLAVALLTDRFGVIDINLPVGGSVNDPQFSVGGIIWKVILNLLGKALTAPFSMFAGAGTSDLSVVEFQPGTARFTPTGEQSLAKVASALAERPALTMTVTGAADTVSERDEAQKAELEHRLQAERRRELLRAAPAGAAAGVAPPPVAAASAPGGVAASAKAPPAATLSADDRARLLKRLYQQSTLPNKPRNALGLLRDLPPAEMETLLLANILVTEDTMRELALQRGLAVRDALMTAGLPSERLFLAAPKLRLSGEGDATWVPKVQLTLASR